MRRNSNGCIRNTIYHICTIFNTRLGTYARVAERFSSCLVSSRRGFDSLLGLHTMNIKAEKLLRGETIISKEPGNSMLPILKSRQPVRIAPTTWEDVEVGDLVYCKVRCNHYTHLVKAKNDKRGCLISNNRGRENGWTKAVYGKVIEIL